MEAARASPRAESSGNTDEPDTSASEEGATEDAAVGEQAEATLATTALAELAAAHANLEPASEAPGRDPQPEDDVDKNMVYEDVVARHPSREKMLGVFLERFADDQLQPEEAAAAAAEEELDNAEPIYAEDDFAEEEAEAPPAAAAEAAAVAGEGISDSEKAYFQRVQHIFEERLEKLYDEEGKEYHKLPMFDERPAMAGYRNADYNRYCNILPFDETRVPIAPTPTNGNTDYINANFLRDNRGNRTFISTQGPLANTLVHFWQMVWEQNVAAIVMLCNLREGGRPKCHQYWPTAPGRSATHGAVKVTLDDQTTEAGYFVRRLTLRCQAETRTLVQFHFTDWPDHGVPRSTASLLGLRQAVRESCPEGPLLVHCSAGVGRSGTYIALDRLLDAVALRAPPAMLDVYTMIAGMRAERYWMVQAEEQYFFLHFCVRDAVIQALFDLADSSQA